MRTLIKNIGQVCGLEQPNGSVAAKLAVARNEVPGGPFTYEYGTGDALVTINFTNIGNVALACPSN